MSQMAAYQAARQWAADHGHPTPDDRMIDAALVAARRGVVVVSFGSAAEDWCTLSRCPMGSADWFPDRDDAVAYAATLPVAFQPHILRVQTDRS